MVVLVESLSLLLGRLEPAHRDALRWFDLHAGETTGWSSMGSEDFRLVSKAKGIYKPAKLNYALSVRQTLTSPYNDQPPTYRPDGTWTYPYFQEGRVGAQGDVLRYTNQALLACARDSVPVGVLRQVRERQPVLYEVLGLALVTEFRDGYFYLEGFSPGGFSYASSRPAALESSVTQVSRGEVPAFDPASLRDLRRRAMASIVQRPGQERFRSKLVDAYCGQCAITGTNAIPALEAAHILPYLGAETNHPANGLLLRADLHTLFDKGLLTVAPEDMRVVLAPCLTRSTYNEISGRPLQMPTTGEAQPSATALNAHRDYAISVWNSP